MPKRKGNKGCLKRQLGLKVDDNIPTSILNRIISSPLGSSIKVKKNKIRITPLLVRRAMLTKRLRRIRKKR